MTPSTPPPSWNEPQPSCAQTTIAISPPPLNSSAATSVAQTEALLASDQTPLSEEPAGYADKP